MAIQDSLVGMFKPMEKRCHDEDAKFFIKKII
jgi:hypothetical protein